MRGLSCLDELWHDELHAVGGDRKAHPIGWRLKLWVDSGERGDTDDVALQIDECPAAVPWVDRRISQNGIGDDRPVLFLRLPR